MVGEKGVWVSCPSAALVQCVYDGCVFNPRVGQAQLDVHRAWKPLYATM